MAASLEKRAAELRPALASAAAASVWPLVAAVALALVLQFFVKPLLGDFVAKVAIDIGTNIILAVSLTMVNGFTGQFSLGHAAFMLVGGYTAAMIVYYGSMLTFGDAMVHGGRISSMLDGRTADDGSPLPLATLADVMFLGALLAGGLVAALCGYLVGLPSLRLRGDYLAIVTLGFGEIVRVLVQSQTGDVLYTSEEVRETAWYLLPSKVGGALGFSGLPFYSNLFWVWVFAFITLIFAFRVKRSSLGRAFLSIREDEIAAEAMGVNTTKYKVKAFVIAAFFAGVAGGLFAHTIGVQLNPGELGFMKSFDIIIMVVLGGLGSISGAALAATVLSILPELLRDPPSIWPWGYLIVILPVVIPSLVFQAVREDFRGVLASAAASAVVLLMLSPAMPPAVLPWAAGATVLAMSGLLFVAHRLPVSRAIVIVLLLAGLWEVLRWAAHAAGIVLADYRMVIYALMLIFMMIARPKGLLGVRELWEPGLWRDALAKSPKRSRA